MSFFVCADNKATAQSIQAKVNIFFLIILWFKVDLPFHGFVRGIEEGRARTSCHLIAEGSGKTCTLQISRNSPRPFGCERCFEPISLSVLPIYQIFSNGITVQTRSVNMSVFRLCLFLFSYSFFVLPNIGIARIIRKLFSEILRTAPVFSLFEAKIRIKMFGRKG